MEWLGVRLLVLLDTASQRQRAHVFPISTESYSILELLHTLKNIN